MSVTDSSIDELRSDLDRGSVMVVSAHLGYWELLVPFLNRILDISGSKKQICIVYKPLHDAQVDHFLRDLRLSDSSYRDHCCMVQSRGSRSLLQQVLERGGLVGILPDQRCSSSSGITCNFLGRPTTCHSGFARMYAEVEACRSLWFVVCKDADGMFDIVAKRIHERTSDGGQKVEAEKLVEAYNQLLEDEVLRSPEQYLWMHNRWKRKGEEVSEA